MQYSRTSSFNRTYRKLTASDRVAGDEAIASLVQALDSGKLPQGLGLKRLQREFWEIRVGLSKRILFQWKGPWITFVVAGNHEDIRRYLKGL